MVDNGFPEISLKLKHCIQRTTPNARHKIHLHNHHIISPGSENARVQGPAVPLRTAHGGIRALLQASGRFPAAWFGPRSPCAGTHSASGRRFIVRAWAAPLAVFPLLWVESSPA
jgi:hypothetical protein